MQCSSDQKDIYYVCIELEVKVMSRMAIVCPYHLFPGDVQDCMVSTHLEKV